MMVLSVVLLLIHAATLIFGSISGPVTLRLTPIDTDLYGEILVGKDKKQGLSTLFDTGCNHVWVVGIDAKSKIESLPYNAFQPTLSKSFKTENKDYTEKYSTGEIFGFKGTDSLTVKTLPKEISFEGIEFGVVTRISNPLMKYVFYRHGAIFGLNLISPEAIPNEPEPSIIKLAKEIPTFGFYIDKQVRSKSVLVFGEPDKSYLDGDFTSHDVVKVNNLYNGWNVKIKGFVVEKPGTANSKQEFGVAGVEYAQLLSRSGAALVGPTGLIKSINDYIFKFASFPIPGCEGQRCTFPCDDDVRGKVIKDLPVLKIVIDNSVLELGPLDYVLSENKKCYSLLIGADIPHFILGNMFLTRYYTKFDYANKKVHFAKSKQIY